MNVKMSEFEKALREAAQQASVEELQDGDWTVDKLVELYPSLSDQKARRVLNSMVDEGKAVMIRVKNEHGRYINAYREKAAE